MSETCTCSCATARRRRRPTATLVIASLALFMSLGGTSYAAVKAKSIGSKQLKSNSVTSTKIARNGVTASDIKAKAVGSSALASNSVDGSKIQPNSIGSQHILDSSIGAQDIQPGSIGAGQIANGSLGPAQIADQSLGTGELSQTTVDLFKDVPVELVLTGGDNQENEPLATDGGFTTMRSFSAPAPATGRTGTNLVQSEVSVQTTTATTITCWISVNGDERAVSTSSVTGRSVIPVVAVRKLAENDIVQTRCRSESSAFADTRNFNGATSMTLMRIAS